MMVMQDGLLSRGAWQIACAPVLRYCKMCIAVRKGREKFKLRPNIYMKNQFYRCWGLNKRVKFDFYSADKNVHFICVI